MISNYTELKTEVADWSHRNDLTDKMDTFCILCESMINYGYERHGLNIPGLRSKEMEKRLSVSFDNTYYSLPSDYIDMIALELEYAGARRPLRQVSPQILDITYSFATGIPRAYTIQGGEIEFRPGIDPTAPYTGELRYVAAVPTLTSTATNSVLTALPSLYLAGMMLQVGVFLEDEDMINLWAAAFNSAVKGANKTSGKYVLPQVRFA